MGDFIIAQPISGRQANPERNLSAWFGKSKMINEKGYICLSGITLIDKLGSFD